MYAPNNGMENPKIWGDVDVERDTRKTG